MVEGLTPWILPHDGTFEMCRRQGYFCPKTAHKKGGVVCGSVDFAI
jgi:hypothetical protein